MLAGRLVRGVGGGGCYSHGLGGGVSLKVNYGDAWAGVLG